MQRELEFLTEKLISLLLHWCACRLHSRQLVGLSRTWRKAKIKSGGEEKSFPPFYFICRLQTAWKTGKNGQSMMTAWHPSWNVIFESSVLATSPD